MPRIPRLRIGIAIGFGVGYYLGAKAGRQRYEQLNQMLRRVTDSGPVHSAATRVRTTIGRSGQDDAPTVDDTIELIQPEWSS